VPLVSKRLHTLCCAPELLRELEVDLIGNRALPRAQALLAWLSQRAAQVRKLELTIKMNDAIATSAGSELVAVVSSCLAVMGAVGQLAELTVSDHTPLPNTIWLPMMRSLQQAYLGTEGRLLRITAGAHLAASLHSLELYGDPVAFEAGAQLPASLTYLYLTDGSSREMPAQVGLIARRPASNTFSRVAGPLLQHRFPVAYSFFSQSMSAARWLCPLQCSCRGCPIWKF
jgi:hypothetical protein